MPDACQRLEPEIAALSAVSALMRLEGMGLPDSFYPSMLDSVHSALQRRRQHGFMTDPTSMDEVGGLVRAAMGDNDHLTAVRQELVLFVVGSLQTSGDLIQRVCDSLNFKAVGNITGR